MMHLRDAKEPRVIVALSAGRGSHKPILDLIPRVQFIEIGESEQLQIDAPGVLGGDVVDFAGSIYGDAIDHFLESRQAAGSLYLRKARLRLQVFDGSRVISQHGSIVLRKAFAEDGVDVSDDEDSKPEGRALKLLVEHTKQLQSSMVKMLADAAADREAMIEYAKGAMQITVDAGDMRAAMLAEMVETAEERARGGFWETPAGEALASTLVGNVGVAMELLKMLIASKSGGSIPPPAAE